MKGALGSNLLMWEGILIEFSLTAGKTAKKKRRRRKKKRKKKGRREKKKKKRKKGEVENVGTTKKEREHPLNGSCLLPASCGWSRRQGRGEVVRA